MPDSPLAGRDLQSPFDVAVVMTTVVRPTIEQAVRSVFAQDYPGRVQVMIGIDRWAGERSTIERLMSECPPRMAVTLVDLGYSTSRRNGGLYPSAYGGALKTLLTWAANSRLVTYLDDDNWWAPEHLSSFLPAIDGKAWAFCLRHFVDAESGEALCPDTWESVGPDRGVYGPSRGGFVDTNCFLIDKLACHDALGEWAMTCYAGGTGGDRQMLRSLKPRPYGESRRHTVFYRQRLEGTHPFLLWHFMRAGVDLDRHMPPGSVPDQAVWAQCEAAAKAAASPRG